MENHVFYLKSCDTCMRIINELELPGSFTRQNIKEETLSPDQLEVLYKLTHSYKYLINSRAQKFKQQGIKADSLTESEAREKLLEDYSFLKRPLFILKGKVYAGNAQHTVEQVKSALKSS